MSGLNSPLFPLEGLSEETFIRLPKAPDAQSASVKLYVILAEPNVFVEGFSKGESLNRPASVLRGCVFLRISKPVKIKSITLKFQGYSRTEWPEGIPPKKIDHTEINSLTQHTWPLFQHTESYPNTENSKNNAQLYIPPNSDAEELTNFSLDPLSPITSIIDDASNSLQPVASPSFSSLAGVLKRATSPAPFNRGGGSPSILAKLNGSGNNGSDLDLTSIRSTDDSQSNKHFAAGDYIYSFEHIIPATTPESSNVTFGSVEYALDAFLERSGTFKSSLHVNKPVNIVRTLSQESSEESEPIVISRDWESSLHYEVVVSSKSVLLNSYLPVAFKLVPLDKIKVHRIRIYITEHLEYFCRGKRVHRTEPPKKFLLLEHKPEEGQDSLLVDEFRADEISGKELEFQVYIPELINDKQKIHPDTSYENIQSHHWIKMCIRISRSANDPNDPAKRKHFELSIDSPLHILSALCIHANTLLPEYVSGEVNSQLYSQPQQQQTKQVHSTAFNDTPLSPDVELVGFNFNTMGNINQSLDIAMVPRPNMNLESNIYKPDENIPIEYKSPQAQPFSPVVSPQLQALHPGVLSRSQVPFSSGIARPIHLLRRPSFNPPAFQDDVAPPDFETSDLPPSYDSVIKQENMQTASEFNADEDLGGKFKFSPDSPDLPAAISRPRSPVAGVGPAAPAPRKTTNVARDITSVLANKSANNSNSSNAIDAALAEAISNEEALARERTEVHDFASKRELETDIPTPEIIKPSLVKPAPAMDIDMNMDIPASTPNHSPELQHHTEQIITLHPTAHVTNGNPTRHPSIMHHINDNERRSSVSSYTASVISENSYNDPVAYQPLLRDESFSYSMHNSVYDVNSSLIGPNNRSFHGLANDSVGDLYYQQRHHDASVDITNMYNNTRGSIVAMTSGPEPHDPSFHVFNPNLNQMTLSTDNSRIFNSRMNTHAKLATSPNSKEIGESGVKLDFTFKSPGLAPVPEGIHSNVTSNTTNAAIVDDTENALAPVISPPTDRRISFGIEPIMAALSVTTPLDEANTADLGAVKGDEYFMSHGEPHLHKDSKDHVTSTTIQNVHQHSISNPASAEDSIDRVAK